MNKVNQLIQKTEGRHGMIVTSETSNLRGVLFKFFN